MERVYNFSAGPAMLPEAVLEEAARELVNYKGTGMSVMEMSHRSSSYDQIHQDTQDLLRELMNIPDHYEILFLQGGASTQFAMVPLNLMTQHGKADYILTGNWAKKAYDEAVRYGDVAIAASSKDANFTYIPNMAEVTFRDEIDYVHICSNNTIYGTRFRPDNLPQTGDVPLVADMSSNILSEVYDVNDFGLIYAGAQKNMGPAGLTVVIIDKALIQEPQPSTPTMLTYKTHADKNSLYNTPPTYTIYMTKLVLEWLKDLGGIEAMAKINQEKADLLYDFIDQSDFYRSAVTAKDDRSLMNIPFLTPNGDLDAQFVKEAAINGLHTLKGHRNVGGLRASIYNAMPIEGVQALVNFMDTFEKNHR